MAARLHWACLGRTLRRPIVAAATILQENCPADVFIYSTEDSIIYYGIFCGAGCSLTMRPKLPGLLAALLPALGAAANAEEFPIFRGRAPGEHGDSEHEHVTNSTDGRLIANVTVPTLSVEWPPAEPGAPPPPVVLVFPGGGFEHLYIDKEGADVVPWLKRLGLGAAVLKYRVPLLLPRPNLPGLRPGLDAAAEIWRPLMDAQRAVGLVRARCAAGVWRCNASAVGVLGFSAGGGLAGALSTHWRERLYPPTDAADTESARPDFSMVTKHHPRPCFQILPQHCPRCVNSVVSCRLLLCMCADDLPRTADRRYANDVSAAAASPWFRDRHANTSRVPRAGYG